MNFPDGRRSHRWSAAAVVVVVVVLGGILGAIAAVLTGGPPEPSPPDQDSPVPEPADPQGFLDAWADSATGTYRLDGVIVRRRGDDRLELPVTLVQRPPDYLRIQAGAIEQRLGNEVTSCSPGLEGGGTCVTRSSPAPTLGELAEHQRRFMAELVWGPDPDYRAVADGPGCWVLTLRRDDPAPPLGRRTRFCFDPGTGAVVERRSDLGQLTEELRVDHLSGLVIDPDLALPRS